LLRRTALALATLTACADTRADADAPTTGASAADDGATDGDGGPASADDPDTGADETNADEASGSDDAVDSSGGDDTSPAACSFAPGCLVPHAIGEGLGVASDAPVGCGDGSFALAHSISVAMFADPEAPRSMPLLADMDDDGTLDLVVNFRKASVGLVFPGLGTGGFANSPAPLAGGIFAGGWGGDLGDVDSDGRIDVVLGDHARGAWAWTNAGAMSFVEARGGLPDALFSGAGLGDFDGDGALDAVFGADQFGSGVRAFAGDGAGGWLETTAPAITAANLGSILAGDLDGDGDLDIVAFGKAGAAVDAFVATNDGGSWSVSGPLPGPGVAGGLADPVQGSLGDIDCDGDLDLAAGGVVYRNEAGGFAAPIAIDGSRIAHFADMNGDGQLDLVTHDASVGLGLWLGDGAGAFARDTGAGLPDAATAPVLDDPYGIDVGDLDGNGSLDIVRIGGFAGDYRVESWVR
jgi:hypothetical protein